MEKYYLENNNTETKSVYSNQIKTGSHIPIARSIILRQWKTNNLIKK